MHEPRVGRAVRLLGEVHHVREAAAQAGEDEGRVGLRGHLGQLGAESALGVEFGGEVHVVDHDERARAVGGGLLRRAEAEADERALVVLAARALEGGDDALTQS